MFLSRSAFSSSDQLLDDVLKSVAQNLHSLLLVAFFRVDLSHFILNVMCQCDLQRRLFDRVRDLGDTSRAGSIIDCHGFVARVLGRD